MRTRGFGAILVAVSLLGLGATVTGAPASAATCPSGPSTWIGTWHSVVAVKSSLHTGAIVLALDFHTDGTLTGAVTLAEGATGTPQAITNGTHTCSTVKYDWGSLTNQHATVSTDGNAMSGVIFAPPYSWSAGRITDAGSTTGTAITTDPGNAGATPVAPLQVSVSSPTGGALSIGRANAPAAVDDGYDVFGPSAQISAPDATTANPLVLTFALDAGVPAARNPVAPFFNGDVVAGCTTQPASTAAPDPCVSSITHPLSGDWSFTVLSSRAGVWSFGAPAAPLSAPRVVSATPKNGAALVTFAPPTNSGGNPIFGYIVTAYHGGKPVAEYEFGLQTKGVAGHLANGKAYRFRVGALRFFNPTQRPDHETGPKSPPSGPLIAGTPVAPTGVNAASHRAASGPAFLTVTYRAAAGNGAPITQFIARCTSANGGKSKSAAQAGATAKPIRVAGVTRHKRYMCTVTAANSRGPSRASSPSRAVVA